ncbi:hypothetical protein [Polaribacter sargassicola]|uniref:hypothetical protein n=1 Tax=Polaribacter sargassicola TaxID=2836891 RepID=UPI001F2CF281|nr:hypothetical protein [Polaribacter sp. DS7-9]MCG1034780.1 hypothetical protein [Polaribacter sp. DS7-9]
MKKYTTLFIILFVGSYCFSQQNTANKSFFPTSIYTINFQVNTNKTPSYSSIKNNLKLKENYKFTTVSFEDIDSGEFNISSNNLTAKSTRFIYDDYKSYRDENLLKGFFKKYDLTRWDPINFKQPKPNVN